MNIKLPTEHHLGFLSLIGGYIGSSESTIVKIPHCWKSHVAAQILLFQISVQNWLKWCGVLCLRSRIKTATLNSKQVCQVKCFLLYCEKSLCEDCSNYFDKVLKFSSNWFVKI